MKYNTQSNLDEGFTNPTTVRCPNILIQKGTKYFLYNSKIAKVPGVNPIQFENLEDYVEFIDWQHSQGIRCPILYLQYTYDAQGNPVYKSRPSIYDLQGGLPSSTLSANPSINPSPTLITSDNNVQLSTDNNQASNNPSPKPIHAPKYNIQGAVTKYNTNQSSAGLLSSPNPMDYNWGGQDFTQALVDSGFYKGNEVSIMV
jgi:hypothetical protein